MGREEIVGSHVACTSSNDGLLTDIASALGAILKLEEVVDLLSMLLVVSVACTLFVEMAIADLAVTRNRSIRTHALL